MIKILLFSMLLMQLPAWPENFNYIGSTADEIITGMANTENEFRYRKTLSVGGQEYLKYGNRLETKTLVFVLDEKGFCTQYMIMYDNMFLKEVEKILNTKYKQTAEGTWTEVKNGKQYLIYLKKGKWYFTVVKMKSGN